MEFYKLEKNDISEFICLIDIFNRVFENQRASLNKKHLTAVLESPNFMAFVIKIDNTTIGGLTVHVLQNYYHTKPVAYIYDVGIDTPFQGQGYGQFLLSNTLSYLEKNAFDHAFVQAETVDKEAVKFYKKSTYSGVIEAIQFTYEFNL